MKICLQSGHFQGKKPSAEKRHQVVLDNAKLKVGSSLGLSLIIVALEAMASLLGLHLHFNYKSTVMDFFFFFLGGGNYCYLIDTTSQLSLSPKRRYRSKWENKEDPNKAILIIHPKERNNSMKRKAKWRQMKMTLLIIGLCSIITSRVLVFYSNVDAFLLFHKF